MTVASGVRTRIGGLGAVGIAILLAVASGIPGAALGIAVVLTWGVVGDIAAFAIAIVAVSVTVDTASLTTVTVEAVAVPITLAALLIGPATRTDRPIAVPVLVLLLTCGVGALATLPLLWGRSLAVAGTVLVVVVSTLSYGLHRYGIVASGVLQHG